MVFKNELYPIHFYGRVRGECDGRLQNWPGIVNERPKFLAMSAVSARLVQGSTSQCPSNTSVTPCGQSTSSKGYVQKRTTKANINH